MTTLLGVSILVTIYPELSKQTLLCNKHNVSNLILRYPHTAPEEFDDATITGHFGFVFEEKTRSRKSHDNRGAFVFEKLRFQNVFSPLENENPAF